MVRTVLHDHQCKCVSKERIYTKKPTEPNNTVYVIIWVKATPQSNVSGNPRFILYKICIFQLLYAIPTAIVDRESKQCLNKNGVVNNIFNELSLILKLAIRFVCLSKQGVSYITSFIFILHYLNCSNHGITHCCCTNVFEWDKHNLSKNNKLLANHYHDKAMETKSDNGSQMYLFT